MGTPPIERWPELASRIAARYAARPIVLRERPVGETGMQSILWRVPLRAFELEPVGDMARGRIAAGHEEPFIRVELDELIEIAFDLDEGGDVRAVQLYDREGARYTLLFDLPD